MAKTGEFAFGVEHDLASCDNPHMGVRRGLYTPACKYAEDNKETTKPEHGLTLTKADRNA